MFLWIAVVVYLTFISETSGFSCTEQQATRCSKPTTNLRKELGISDELKHFPIYLLNDTYLDKYCKVASQTAYCLHNMDNCPVEVELVTEGLRKATNYLCEETLDEYVTYQDCHKQVTVQRKLEACDKKYERRFQLVRDKSDLCQTVDEWYNCIRQAAKPECTDAAAEWQVNYVKKFVEPSMDKINCGALSKFVLIIIIGACIAAVVVLVIIGYVCCCKKRNTGGTPSPVLTFSKDGMV